MLTTSLTRILLAGIVLSPAATLAAELPKTIVDRGSFNLAINATFPPMEYVNPDKGEFEGLDIDIVDAVADRLGLEVERTDGLFNQLIPALTTGRTDFILSGMIDNAERRETMDFVNYLRAGAQFYVLTGSEIKEPIELCGKTISTVRSTTYPALTEKWSNENCVAAGLEPITIIGGESSPEVRMQVRQGRAVAGVIGGETMAFVNSQEGNLYRLIGKPLVDAYYGAAFRKEDSELRDVFADTLQQLIDDGTYTAILEKWDLKTHAIDAVLINSEPRG